MDEDLKEKVIQSVNKEENSLDKYEQQIIFEEIENF